MLMNYGYDSLNCFTLILRGESHLNDILRKPIHEALRQRITIHYNYERLDDHEISQYILHKLNCAGASRSIISEAALSAIHGYSRGNPRRIDNLMTNTLTIGANRNARSLMTRSSSLQSTIRIFKHTYSIFKTVTLMCL
jgi:general secretion pathway protein A